MQDRGIVERERERRERVKRETINLFNNQVLQLVSHRALFLVFLFLSIFLHIFLLPITRIQTQEHTGYYHNVIPSISKSWFIR